MDEPAVDERRLDGRVVDGRVVDRRVVDEPRDELSERRAHKRHPVSFDVRCRRLGPRRAESTQVVDVVDLSVGGMRITAPPWVDVGNVVEVDIDGAGLRSLVVAVSGRTRGGGPAYAHLAFGSLSAQAFGAVVDLLDTYAGAG